MGTNIYIQTDWAAVLLEIERRTIQYDTIPYIYVRSKADIMSSLI